eukprot:GHVL01018473.1.p1 GENE.GHVL01018473.1~~GHVL01018473.1.p1  ORF type:complete len:609 (+),score=194.04 GHVL01018473.1:320-2146(+)
MDILSLIRPKSSASDKSLSFRVEYQESSSLDKTAPQRLSQAPPGVTPGVTPGVMESTAGGGGSTYGGGGPLPTSTYQPSQCGVPGSTSSSRIQQLLAAEQTHRASVLEELLQSQNFLEIERDQNKNLLREIDNVKILLQNEKKKRTTIEEENASNLKLAEQRGKILAELEAKMEGSEESLKERIQEHIGENELIKKKFDAAENEVQRINKEKNEISENLRRIRERCDELEVRNRQSNEKLERNKTRISRLEQQANELENEVEGLQKKSVDLQQTVDGLKSQIFASESNHSAIQQKLTDKEFELKSFMHEKRELLSRFQTSQSETARMKSVVERMEKAQMAEKQFTDDQNLLMKKVGAYQMYLAKKIQLALDRPNLVTDIISELNLPHGGAEETAVAAESTYEPPGGDTSSPPYPVIKHDPVRPVENTPPEQLEIENIDETPEEDDPITPKMTPRNDVTVSLGTKRKFDDSPPSDNGRYTDKCETAAKKQKVSPTISKNGDSKLTTPEFEKISEKVSKTISDAPEGGGTNCEAPGGAGANCDAPGGAGSCLSAIFDLDAPTIGMINEDMIEDSPIRKNSESNVRMEVQNMLRQKMTQDESQDEYPDFLQ